MYQAATSKKKQKKKRHEMVSTDGVGPVLAVAQAVYSGELWNTEMIWSRAKCIQQHLSPPMELNETKAKDARVYYATGARGSQSSHRR